MTNFPEQGSEHTFDQDYWDRHYRDPEIRARGRSGPGAPNPHLVRETATLVPGSALDAGCGEGAEARWLAEQGWDVTAVDIASEALDRARSSGGAGAASGRVEWVEADLGAWEPVGRFDLVATHYAHPAMPQLDFYDRIAAWVAPGGTLLVVAHYAADHHSHAPAQHAGESGHPPERATVTAAEVTGRLGGHEWEILTAEECTRTVTRGGVQVPLDDVVVRAVRRWSGAE